MEFLKLDKFSVGNLEQSKSKRSHRVRDHLANERTYLAWMRSGIALLGFGVLIVRLRILHPPLAPQPPGNGWKLGLAFGVVGLLTVILSTYHYFAASRGIDEDNYQPANLWVIVSSITVLFLGIGVLYYVFSIPFDSANAVLVE